VSLLVDALIVFACLCAGGCFAGSETAFYTVSRVRVEIEARQGRRAARIVQRLLADDVSLLIVLLIGNLLAIELITFQFEDILQGLGVHALVKRVLLALVLTPLVFFFGEALPKDLFRRRPHALLAVTAPLIACARFVFYPLTWLLARITGLVTHALGFEPRLLSVVRGREMVLRLLREGAQTGAILPQAETLARNVLKLRSIPVERAMIPWKNVVTLASGAAGGDQHDVVARSTFTRLPVLAANGSVLGYVHQLDVLRAGRETPIAEHMRPLISVPPELAVDRALARLRASGQRLAVVGTLERPFGLVTLKDLLEEISGDLAEW
jgi:CBS domain containing-hemolysin-like protein